MLFKQNKPTPTKPPKNAKPNLQKKRADTDLKSRKQEEEKESAVDSDELNDMVYDIEYGKALLQRADDFLDNKPSVDLTSESSSSNKVSFISQNKDKAYNAQGARQRMRRNKDKLDPAKQQRYDELLQQVEDNIDNILKDREDQKKLLLNDG